MPAKARKRPGGSHIWHAPRPITATIRLVAVVLVVEFLLVPQLAGTRKSWHLLLGVNPTWIVVGLVLELASLLAYALLTRELLARGARGPSLWTLARVDLSTLAVSHVVPAGSAVGLGLGFRLLTQAGVPGGEAAVAKATQAIGSAVVLNIILLLSLVVAVPVHGSSSIFGIVALIAVLLLGAAATSVAVITRGEQRLAPWLGHHLGRFPGLSAQRVEDGLHLTAKHLKALTTDRRLLTRTITFAAANWLLDAGALWCCVRAFGHALGIDGLLVSYGIAGVLAALPFTPAGIGVVEAFLIPAFVGFSVPRGIAILGVLSWRTLSVLLPIPLGLAAYLSLPISTAESDLTSSHTTAEDDH